VYLKKFSGGIAPGPPGDGRGEEGEGREGKGDKGKEENGGREGRERRGGDTGLEGRDWAPPMFDTDRRPWMQAVRWKVGSVYVFCLRFVIFFEDYLNEYRCA
jgi:hypothetical protein